MTKSKDTSVSGKKWEYVEKAEAEESVFEESTEAEKNIEEIESLLADEHLAPDELEVMSKDELIKQIKTLKQEVQDNFERFARAQAEIKNIQHTTRKDVENARKFALKPFVQELVNVVDNFERSLEVLESASEQSSLHEGITLTHKSLLDVLEKFGVEQVNPLNERFNPELHEAMSMQPNADVAPNTVIIVFQKGYLLNGRLIRPARVIVSQ